MTCLMGIVSSCTTLATKITVAPPGINRFSFRECLYRQGFFAGTALTDLSATDFNYRRALETQAALAQGRHLPPPPDLPDGPLKRINGMSDAAFVFETASILHASLFPHLQYNDVGDHRPFAGDAVVADPVYNRPYVADLWATGDGRYETTAPGPAMPHRLDFKVNRYLDCYLGPVGTDEEVSVTGDYDREGRLLRAHMLLAMLTAYGTELVTSAPGKQQTAQAATLLAHIRDAELALRSSSAIMNEALRETYDTMKTTDGLPVVSDPDARPAAAATPAIPIPIPAAPAPAPANPIANATRLVEPFDRGGQFPGLRWYDYATRLLRVFQIGVDVEVIDARQSLDRITNVIGAFSHPTPAAATSVLKDALKGLGTVQKVQIVGAALRLDSGETLAEHRVATHTRMTTGPQSHLEWVYDVRADQRLWQSWDTDLDRSCKLLANVAKQSDAGCIPTDAGMAEQVRNTMPPAAKAR